jgi:hypothetical protein
VASANVRSPNSRSTTQEIGNEMQLAQSSQPPFRKPPFRLQPGEGEGPFPQRFPFRDPYPIPE